MINQPSTFWTLMKEYIVTIPIIQRDYAQGREDNRTEQIRNNFLDELCSAIEKPCNTLPLHLDFIYGSVTEIIDIDGHKNNILTLLDGQQRITTLFLLHCYLARQADVLAEANKQLQRFTYQTRASSKAFCIALVNEDLTLSVDNRASKQIEDSPWFYRSWKKDPTIKAMLVMINAIHDKLKGKTHTQYVNLWTTLTDPGLPPPITFHFLCEYFGTTDEFYIKMNARGEFLTDFENFKVWMEGYVENKKWINFPIAKNKEGEFREWQGLLDIEWTDLFWNSKPEGSYEIDAAYLRFFKGMALNHFLCKKMEEDDTVTRDALISEVTDDSFMPKKSFEKLFIQDTLIDIFHVLHRLSEGRLEELGKTLQEVDLFLNNTLFKSFIYGGNTLTYKVRIMFHALCRFLIEQPESFVPEALIRWMRVVRNLTVNSNFGKTEFALAVRTINIMAREASGDILSWLAKEDRKLHGFLPCQFEEEKKKAELILSPNKNWEAVLAEAENHTYFQGQIHFLIKMAQDDEDGSVNIEQFQRYFRIGKQIFDEEKGLINHEKFLVQCALLVNGDYLPNPSASNFSFGNGKEEWRSSIFRDSKSLKILKRLLDQLQPDTDLVILTESLTKIINEYIRAREECRAMDWEYYFIKYPQAIGICGQRIMSFLDNGHYILLLSGERTSSSHAELRSYCFHLGYLEPMREAFVPFVLKDYKKKRSVHYEPYALLDHTEYSIKIRYPRGYQENPYEVSVARKDGNTISELTDNFEWRIQQDGTSFYDYFARYPDEEATLEGLKDLIKLIQLLLSRNIIIEEAENHG